MALPGSGTISVGDIQIELGIGEGDPGYDNFGFDQARDGDYGAINQCSTYKPPSSGPISLSDWWGYDHTQACPPSYGLYTADEYYCDVNNECTFSLSNVLVAFELPFTPNYAKFYGLQAGGFYYSLIEEVFTGPGAICNASPNYTNCDSWCTV